MRTPVAGIVGPAEIFPKVEAMYATWQFTAYRRARYERSPDPSSCRLSAAIEGLDSGPNS